VDAVKPAYRTALGLRYYNAPRREVG
jgi:hypothetical protein